MLQDYLQIFIIKSGRLQINVEILCFGDNLIISNIFGFLPESLIAV